MVEQLSDLVHVFDPGIGRFTWVPHPRLRFHHWKSRPHYDSQLRIGFAGTTYQPIGGTETYHRTLIPRLQNVVGFASETIAGDPTPLGVPSLAGREAIRLLAASVDVLIVWGVFGLRDLIDQPRPKIINAHHGDVGQTWFNHCIDDGAEVSDLIVCVNPIVAAQQRDQGRNAIYIPNAINPARTIRTSSPGQIRAKYGIDPEAKILFWCARLASEKRPQLACDIADAMPDDWTTVIAGSGHVPITSDRARIIGKIDCPGDLLSISDCFISTATFEGFGISIGEAMLAGVPVVSTPLGIASDPRLAYHVSTDAPVDDWVEAILSHSQDLKFARQAADLVGYRYSIDHHVDAWQEAITKTITKTLI